MLLRAAAVPPPEVREQIPELVGAASAPGTGLTLIPADRLHVVIAQFGNLPTEEASRLSATLAEAMSDLGTAPTLSTGGGAVADERRHQVVVADLACDVDRLAEVARDVGVVVQTRRLFVDRRRFSPVLPVGPARSRHVTERGR